MTSRSAYLVFVPGLGCTADLFAEQIATLRGDVSISVADHTRHDTMSGIAGAILAAAPNRFALCGLSMGGYIAFEMMRQAPDRVERLALLDTTALSDTPQQTERRLKLIAMAQSGEFIAVCDTLWPLFVHPARHSDAALKRAVFKMIHDTGPDIFVRQQKAILSRLDSRSSLEAIHCPTLVLVGNEDILTPVSAARTIADGIVGSKLHIVQDCGHLSTMEQPDAVTETLRAWLDL
ncbi:MAG TPA: alpha/beta fold hydrolase [Methylocella sp.]|nr:alpha/beta fold hydrolase [Methylocella sp.]